MSHAIPFAEKLSAYSLLLNIDDPVIFSTQAEVFKANRLFPEALAAFDETIALFANNVVARCGRAEVLKEMGNYPEALAAFDETIALFANDRFVRNGLANLLILSGRGDEVPSLLNINMCMSKHDWRDYHVVAMSYLRIGNLGEAIQRLEYGLNKVPFLDSKTYFANALAYAKIKKKEYADIDIIFKNLPEQYNPLETQKRHLFLAHSKAALNKISDAISEFELVPAIGNIHLVKLKEFLDMRYCFSGQMSCAADDEYERIDHSIEEEEFLLLMTRKAA